MARTFLRHAWRELRRRRAHRQFKGSTSYWEHRYAQGGTSGRGSAGALARFKAEQVNRLVREHDVNTVLELGCGDGQQLDLLEIPDYVGVDVSPTAVEACHRQFADIPGRRFFVAGEETLPRAEMSLSMQVLLHLVEDDVFDRYMRDLFGSATRLVVIADADTEYDSAWPHQRFRQFTAWIDQNIDGWQLTETVAGPDTETPRCDVHVYRPV